jgi:hypothetical protein
LVFVFSSCAVSARTGNGLAGDCRTKWLSDQLQLEEDRERNAPRVAQRMPRDRMTDDFAPEPTATADEAFDRSFAAVNAV